VNAILAMTGRFCVYSHSSGGVIFYVGSGPLSRAFDVSSRNREWKTLVASSVSYEVSVHSWHATRKQAYLEELKVLQALRPFCNLKNGTLKIGESCKKVVFDISTSRSYLSIREACESLDISRNKLNKLLVEKTRFVLLG
jgi:hypothetical protein